jgi:hypothetical protein
MPVLPLYGLSIERLQISDANAQQQYISETQNKKNGAPNCVRAKREQE